MRPNVAPRTLCVPSVSLHGTSLISNQLQFQPLPFRQTPLCWADHVFRHGVLCAKFVDHDIPANPRANNVVPTRHSAVSLRLSGDYHRAVKRRNFLSLLAAAGVPAGAQSNDQLNFLTGLPDGRKLNEMLPNYVNGKAFALLDQRSGAVAKLSTAAELEARRRYVRQKLMESVGEFPARTPLNARVVGTLDRGDHRVEKVIFESQPKFYVTANLYLPKSGQAPYPAILFPLGHEEGAKAHSAWQSVLVSLARKGFVCLAWDPIGQGERIQLWDDDFKNSKVIRSTTEHTILGIQSILLGDTLARYTIWDGIRALDYLLSRPEVDAKRIGVTGNSGGGTHTAYLAALDDRIHVAAPSCYITSWRRLIETIGPQDAEQCLPGWLAAGLDHGDFILSFAPKPYLMLSAIRDFFSITGARETYARIARRV